MCHVFFLEQGFYRLFALLYMCVPLVVVADWIVESGRSEQQYFEMLEVEDLASLLKEFYFCVCTKKQERYSRSAYKNIRAGLQRHLESKPFYRKYVISKDREFSEANHVFQGYLAKLGKDGLDRTTRKREIEQEDIKKLYDNVFQDTAQGLLYRTFYEVVSHFGRRGREGLRQLSKGFLTLKTDASG